VTQVKLTRLLRIEQAKGLDDPATIAAKYGPLGKITDDEIVEHMASRHIRSILKLRAKRAKEARDKAGVAIKVEEE
jgi:hypothetical protein